MELDATALPLHSRRARLALALAASSLALAALLFVVLPASGAAVIEYFNVISSSSAVLLEWSTASEYDVAGFEVLCKVANEPRSAYHRIGYFPAKGGPAQGAQYDMLVTALKPGVSYCFSLHEVTSNGEPGESRERCGYGLNITPTPALATLTPTIGLTPTVVLFPTPTFDPFLQQQSPLPTPTFDPFLQPSPLPTPLGAAPFETPDMFAASAEDQALLENAGAAPTPDATATLIAASVFPSPTPPAMDPAVNPAMNPATDPATDPALQPQSPLPGVTPTLYPTATLMAATDAEMAAAAPAGAVLANAPDNAQPQGAPVEPAPTDSAQTGGAGAVEVTATPTSLYVVVTAAPTAAAQGVPPAVTPWPTATPAPGMQLASLTQPTAQNLTVLLLCFIFISASGLGMLGLVTSVLYMRSRSQRQQDEQRVRLRRRI